MTLVQRSSNTTIPNSIHYLAGVDGGGTSTRVRVVHRSGQVVGEARSGPSGLSQGSAQAWQHITQALDQVVLAHPMNTLPTDWPALNRDNCWLGLGLAGANNAAWGADFYAANPGYPHAALYSDAETALAGAHAGAPGILVIMGTGSVALARQANGSLASAGGWGFPSGDEGSGGALGLQAMRLAQQAMDGRLAPTPLTEAVRAATGTTAEAMLAWCGAATQFHYATLAPLVLDLAADDALAADLVRDTVRHLANLALAVDVSRQLPLVVAGSIGARLVPQLPPDLIARLVPARGDAMDGALTLLRQTGPQRSGLHSIKEKTA